MGQKMPAIRINLKDVPSKAMWYTVVTKFNYEKKVASDIMSGIKNMGLEENILDTIVPIKEYETVIKTSTGKSRKSKRVEKIYPLYVFVKAKMNEQVWDYIRSITGVATVLAAGGVILTMSDEEVLPIKDACGLLEKEKETEREERRKNIDQLKRNFHGSVGSRVKVTYGIFENYFGSISKIDFDKNKINVSIDPNGVNVELNLEDLQLV